MMKLMMSWVEVETISRPASKRCTYAKARGWVRAGGGGSGSGMWVRPVGAPALWESQLDSGTLAKWLVSMLPTVTAVAFRLTFSAAGSGE
jgi:hypothetical protein